MFYITLFKNELNGHNFLEWEKALRRVLVLRNIQHVLETPPPSAPGPNASQIDRDHYVMRYGEYELASIMMIGSMCSDLQKQCERMDSYAMMLYLKDLFEGEARYDRFCITKELYSCKMAESDSVEEHGKDMLDMIERLKKLGVDFPDSVSVDIILGSLPESYSDFIQKYHRGRSSVEPATLVNMLKESEQLKALEAGSGRKKRRAMADGSGICFYCGRRHWKHNCQEYLESLQGQNVASSSGTQGRLEAGSKKRWASGSVKSTRS